MNLGNPILRRAEMKLEGKLTPTNREDYMRIVVAGLRVALNKGPDGLMAKLKDSPDPLTDAAEGAIGIVIAMNKHVGSKMPPQALVPAAMGLMLQALDFIDRTKRMPIGKPELDQATHIFTDTIFRALGITAPQLNKAASLVHGITQDPTKMEMINRRIGAVRDPRASTPTQMPADSNEEGAA